jgi:hypothetical protein
MCRACCRKSPQPATKNKACFILNDSLGQIVPGTFGGSCDDDGSSGGGSGAVPFEAPVGGLCGTNTICLTQPGRKKLSCSASLQPGGSFGALGQQQVRACPCARLWILSRYHNCLGGIAAPKSKSSLSIFHLRLLENDFQAAPSSCTCFSCSCTSLIYSSLLYAAVSVPTPPPSIPSLAWSYPWSLL